MDENEALELTDEKGDVKTKLKELRARLVETPELREEYERIDEEYALIEARARTSSCEVDAG